MDSCCKGPGYANPLEAIKGQSEKLLYTTVTYKNTGISKPDYLATIDVDPFSKTYSQVIHRLEMPNIGDELHHMGWNACSSCHGDNKKSRRFLVLPSVVSGNIYIVDVLSDAKSPQLFKVIQGQYILEQKEVTYPHTSHCLSNGDIIISYMGDKNGDALGSFLTLDSDFNIKNNDWQKSQYGYDFWYQPFHNVLISSEWGSPNALKNQFDPSQVLDKYGNKLQIYDWQNHNIIQTLDLGDDGRIPLEIRFAHDPKKDYGFVGAALSSNIILFYKDQQLNTWKWRKVIDVQSKIVENWALPQMPGLITDILLSLDDKYLYLSNWLHGDIRQYDISDPHNPILKGQIFIGGSIRSDNNVLVKDEEKPKIQNIQGNKLRGGPQMLQLSLDGKRLYVTNSLFSSWDNQFYPDLIQNGSHMIQIDVNIDHGGLSINQNFFIDFGKEPNGPALAHEVRYPGGDCTSDIWLY